MDKDLAAIMETDVDPETLMEKESAPSEEIETETPELEAEPEQETEPEAEADELEEKKQTGLDKRFRKLTTKINTLEAEKERYRQKAEQFERQYAPAEAMPQESDPDVDYDDERLAIKRARFFARQEAMALLNEERSRENSRAIEGLFADHISRSAKANIEGYDSKVNALLEEFGPNNPRLGTMYDVILQDRQTGPQVEAFLGANIAKAREIAEMDPKMQLFELGKISARLSQSSPQRKTKAPPPVQTAGSGGALSTPLEKITDIDQMMAKLNAMDDI